MEDFLILLKRYSAQSCKCYERDASRGGSVPHGWVAVVDHHPYPLQGNPYVPLSALEQEIRERLTTTDFLAPYGWPDSVGQALESFRSGELFYHTSRFFDRPLVVKGRDRERVELAFNPAKARAVLGLIDRAIGDIEAALIAGQGIGDRRTGGGIKKGLRDRLELILAVFDKDNPGPFRAKEIAKRSGLNNNAHLREDLSELKTLGFIDNDGRGYTRTAKPYPNSMS
jgi:hypothetical protein